MPSLSFQISDIFLPAKHVPWDQSGTLKTLFLPKLQPMEFLLLCLSNKEAKMIGRAKQLNTKYLALGTEETYPLPGALLLHLSG